MVHKGDCNGKPAEAPLDVFKHGGPAKEAPCAQSLMSEQVVAHQEGTHVRELDEVNRRLLEANRMKSEFVATMSHELRTPLNSIIGFTEVLLSGISGPLNPVQTEQLRMVATAGADLLKLINEILELSRMEAGKATLDITRFSLAECVQGCLDSVQQQVAARHLTLRVSGLDTLPLVKSDASRVRQIVLNMLSNAIKFTHEGGLEVQGDTTGDHAVVRIKDSGVGIGADRMPLLFRAFSHAGSDPSHEGAGLGLYISRKLAAVLGGSIDLQSEVGRGTTVTLMLPLQFLVPDLMELSTEADLNR